MTEQVDLVVDGGSVITMDPSRRVLRDAAIAVDGDRIVAVGPRAEVTAAYEGRERIDAGRRVTTPGFVNAHIHFYHQMHRGLAPDTFDGSEWSNYVHDSFATVITEEDELWAARSVLLELMKSGTTTYLGAGSYNPGPVLEAIPEVGLRGFESRRTYDYSHLAHASLIDDTDTAIRANEEVMERYADGFRDGLVRPCVNIVGLGRCTDELLVASKELADRYGTILNLHQCAFVQEVDSVKERTGVTPIKHLHNLGVLGPNVVLAHMIHVTDEEIDLLAETGANVAHNPGTALKIVYGLSKGGKFPEMLQRGVNVALGTDAGDCANFMDMVRAMYLAALLFKDIRFDPSLMGAETALEMATINGAKAVGMADEIGSIEVGKKADLVLFDIDTPEWQPLYYEPYNLVYSAAGGSVDTVVVDGRVVMAGREVRTIDEAEVMARMTTQSQDFLRRSGVDLPARWPVG